MQEERRKRIKMRDSVFMSGPCVVKDTAYCILEHSFATALSMTQQDEWKGVAYRAGSQYPSCLLLIVRSIFIFSIIL